MRSQAAGSQGTSVSIPDVSTEAWCFLCDLHPVATRDLAILVERSCRRPRSRG